MGMPPRGDRLLELVERRLDDVLYRAAFRRPLAAAEEPNAEEAQQAIEVGVLRLSHSVVHSPHRYLPGDPPRGIVFRASGGAF